MVQHFSDPRRDVIDATVDEIRNHLQYIEQGTPTQRHRHKYGLLTEMTFFIALVNAPFTECTDIKSFVMNENTTHRSSINTYDNNDPANVNGFFTGQQIIKIREVIADETIFAEWCHRILTNFIADASMELRVLEASEREMIRQQVAPRHVRWAVGGRTGKRKKRRKKRTKKQTRRKKRRPAKQAGKRKRTMKRR